MDRFSGVVEQRSAKTFDFVRNKVVEIIMLTPLQPCRKFIVRQTTHVGDNDFTSDKDQIVYTDPSPIFPQFETSTNFARFIEK